MPREWDTIAGLCVGTTKVSVIVAEVDPRYQSQDSIHVIGIGNAPSRGLSKGVITNLTEATDSVRKAFNEALNITNKRIDSAIVAFNALDVRSI
nr:cell division protein FtsA [Synergistaceae bacterium]